MTISTKSKNAVIEYKYGKFNKTDYAKRFEAVAKWETAKNESTASDARNFRAGIVADMKAENPNLTDVQIGNTLGITKQEVAKLALRHVAVSHGLDPQGLARAIDAKGNGITKVKIDQILEQGKKNKQTKEQVKEQLVALGLATKETPKRKAGQAKTRAEKINADLATLDAIFDRAISGKTSAVEIQEKMETLSMKLWESLGK